MTEELSHHNPDNYPVLRDAGTMPIKVLEGEIVGPETDGVYEQGTGVELYEAPVRLLPPGAISLCEGCPAAGKAAGSLTLSSSTFGEDERSPYVILQGVDQHGNRTKRFRVNYNSDGIGSDEVDDALREVDKNISACSGPKSKLFSTKCGALRPYIQIVNEGS